MTTIRRENQVGDDLTGAAIANMKPSIKNDQVEKAERIKREVECVCLQKKIYIEVM